MLNGRATTFFLPSLKLFLDNQSQKKLQLLQQPTMIQDGTETKYKLAVLQKES